MTPVQSPELLQQIARAWERTAQELSSDLTVMRAEVNLTRLQLETERAKSAASATKVSELESEVGAMKVKLDELVP